MAAQARQGETFIRRLPSLKQPLGNNSFLLTQIIVLADNMHCVQALKPKLSAEQGKQLQQCFRY